MDLLQIGELLNHVSPNFRALLDIEKVIRRGKRWNLLKKLIYQVYHHLVCFMKRRTPYGNHTIKERDKKERG